MIALVESCAARRPVRLGYRSQAGAEWVMDVDTWAVVVRHGRWYLLCWSHTKDALRVLRVVDIRMPRVDGIEATRRIVLSHPDTRVLILTTFDLDESLYAAMTAGASAFLLKDAPPEQLIAGIRMVAAGEALVAPAITKRLIERFVERSRPDSRLLERLTERERDILRLVARGRSNHDIAEDLHLADATVKTHISRIYPKLGVRDRAQAVVVAYEECLVEPGHTSSGEP